MNRYLLECVRQMAQCVPVESGPTRVASSREQSAMNSRQKQTLDRTLAITLALALAWIPGVGRATCGCDVCNCPAPHAEARCCQPTADSACYGEVLSRNCCDGARSTADACRCEV